MKTETIQPKISVLLPVKNEEKFIKEAINSILRQSYLNFEVVIVDDGSADRTVTLVKEIQDTRIRLIETAGIGKNAAFNLAYSNATGGLFCYFAGDDLMSSLSLEHRATALLNTSDGSASVAKLRTISTDPRFDNVIIPKTNSGNFSGGTIMFDKHLANKIFPLPEFLANEDMWTVAVIKEFATQIVHIPEVVLDYRIHENNSNKKNATFAEKTESMHKRFIVYGTFAEKFRYSLTSEKKEHYANLFAAETLRYQRNTLAILLMRKLNLSEKLRFASYSSKILYFLRTKFFKLFSS